MSILNETIHLSQDEYLKLVSAQLVLNCLKSSMTKYKELVKSGHENNVMEKRKLFNLKRW
jgi:hypothetical protein